MLRAGLIEASVGRDDVQAAERDDSAGTQTSR
jgi:hypothetical protein